MHKYISWTLGSLSTMPKSKYTRWGRERVREREEKGSAYIMRGIYIAFKSLERLIIIVIISRRKYRREENGWREWECAWKVERQGKRGREKAREREPEWKCVKEESMWESARETRSLIYIHNTKYKLYKYINKFNVTLISIPLWNIEDHRKATRWWEG